MEQFCATASSSIRRLTFYVWSLTVTKERLLLIDDDRRMAQANADWLSEQGWPTTTVSSIADAVAAFQRHDFGLCLVDVGLPDRQGLQFIETLRKKNPRVGIVAMVPQQSGVGGALAALHAGSDDMLSLPVRDDELIDALDRARLAASLRRAAEPRETLRHIEGAGKRLRSHGVVVGDDPAIREILAVVDKVANTNVTVLITGESGTGKSLIARALHRASDRRNQPFVEVACGALSESLLDSELFGHVAGAFTGAVGSRDGKFVQADGGTIFLDEIATASAGMQVKLLRVLQECEFEPVGGSKTRTVDSRVVLATNEDLAEAVASGRFRGDLFWRVNVVSIEMPALRNRAGDIPMLARHFLNRTTESLGRPQLDFTPIALETMQQYVWPGNVRELANTIERAVLLGAGAAIDVKDLPETVRLKTTHKVSSASRVVGEPSSDLPLKWAMQAPERQMILDALGQSGWRRDEAAKRLGINRTTLYKKLKRLGMELSTLGPACGAVRVG